MPPTLGTALASAVRAGAGGLLLAAAGVAAPALTALPVGALGQVALWPVAVLFEALLLVALIRLLAAWRPEPVPPPPAVDDEGRRVLRLAVTAPPDRADRSPVVAVRRSAALGRALLRWVGVQLVLTAVAVLMVLPFAPERITELGEEDLAPGDQIAVLVPIQLVAVLLLTFVALVPQRMALEGEPRVLLAAAHSTKVARAAYGPLFLTGLVLLGPELAAAAVTAWEAHPLGYLAAGLVAVPLRLGAAALFTELYLRGPRVDIAVES